MHTAMLPVDRLNHLLPLARRLGVGDQLTDAQVEGGYADACQLFLQGQHRRAGMVLVLLSLHRPDQARLWYSLGQCCRRLKDYDGAVQTLARCLNLDDRHLGAGIALVECLLLSEQMDPALRLLPALVQTAREAGDKRVQRRAAELLVRLQGACA